MQKAKLLKLANFLQKMPPECRFDMSFWTAHEDEICDPHAWGEYIKNPKHICQSSACAIGWYCLKVSPRGQLKLKHQIDGGYIPVYKNHKDFKAVAKFFNITQKEADALFSPDSYEDEMDNKEVAKAIKLFVKERKLPSKSSCYS